MDEDSGNRTYGGNIPRCTRQYTHQRPTSVPPVTSHPFSCYLRRSNPGLRGYRNDDAPVGATCPLLSKLEGNQRGYQGKVPSPLWNRYPENVPGMSRKLSNSSNLPNLAIPFCSDYDQIFLDKKCGFIISKNHNFISKGRG
jgi:hypothetical protein